MKQEPKIKAGRIALDVKGMTCMHCAGTVKKAVESVEGTSEVIVDLQGNKVEFNLNDPNQQEQVKQQIISAGYEV